MTRKIKHYGVVCMFVGAFGTPAASQTQSGRAGDALPAVDFTESLTVLLGQIVTDDGLVRYDLLRGPLNMRFRSVLRAVETFDLDSLDAADRKAFWINAYNVQMLQNIVETSGVENIVEDDFGEKFFRTPFMTAGIPITLDEIEHVVLRRAQPEHEYGVYAVDNLDPRIHVALNCAAVSCPRLRQTAYSGRQLVEQLDEQMRAFVNDPEHISWSDGTLVLSSLLDWFGADFDRTMPAGSYLLWFMDPSRPNFKDLSGRLSGKSSAEIRKSTRVKYEYDWAVNDADRRLR